MMLRRVIFIGYYQIVLLATNESRVQLEQNIGISKYLLEISTTHLIDFLPYLADMIRSSPQEFIPIVRYA